MEVEEMDRSELRELCDLHSFTYDKIGEYLRIHSKRDTWYILDLELDDHLITLYHQNEYNDSNFHKQGNHSCLGNIFKSISSHDQREQLGHRNNKLTRITNTFKLLGLYN